MSRLGETLFSGSRFVFWTLAPAVALFMVLTPLLVTEWHAGTVALVAVLWVAGPCFILGLWNPRRFRWALRLVAGAVFLAYAAYLVSVLVEDGCTGGLPASRSESNALNALFGLVLIGGPALTYALCGRFSKADGEGMDGPPEEEE